MISTHMKNLRKKNYNSREVTYKPFVASASVVKRTLLGSPGGARSGARGVLGSVVSVPGLVIAIVVPRLPFIAFVLVLVPFLLVGGCVVVFSVVRTSSN